MFIDKKKVIVVILLLIAMGITLFLNYSKDCNKDEGCFNKYLSTCSKAKATLYVGENEQLFEILGSKQQSCMILTKITLVDGKATPEVKKFLEGKGMVCDIPKTVLAKNKISEVSSFGDYCTGPLKEALLQITVEKLYEIIVKNLGAKALESYQSAFGTPQ